MKDKLGEIFGMVAYGAPGRFAPNANTFSTKQGGSK